MNQETTRDSEKTSEEFQKVLKTFLNLSRSYQEVRSFTVQMDLLLGEAEFRLRLAHRSGEPPTGDSKERKDD